ncbi:MBL fold metallo-hydrolase [Panacibacter ginsenosidivorans]|uniref:MBL fold metallo-hydrolase n=1 Tax=Panacibacter ginsenosidivorans TaxID=1813871 RepID=A0A5B8VET7_9BACT|nr:MBL fold metallo-hydrolase [Panacibacter ginsenosidivorans]QEC68808.1 MBL fold metallo-hydrolase [Panacibacter ginsenosidivorans]
MKLYTIDTGNFKLDGGAMFGVVPKSIWNKLNPSDENNMCDWAMRCLLIEDEDKLILIDNGLGNKQDAKFFSYYYLHGDATLDSSLAKHGFHKDDITDVILTHLHFDHCGGSIDRVDGKLVPAFKNATFWSNERHWNWATRPNEREKASFLKENILPIQEHGQLKFVPDEEGYQLFENIKIRFVNGHTDAMMLPQINYNGRTIIYMADLLPATYHIPLPYVMAYDMFPLTTLNEKKSFLTEALANDYILYFEHDPVTECCTLQQTERGIREKEKSKLSDI